jgi:hypothetical protein
MRLQVMANKGSLTAIRLFLVRPGQGANSECRGTSFIPSPLRGEGQGGGE